MKPHPGYAFVTRLFLTGTLCVLSEGCLLPPGNPAVTKTRIHANREIRDTAGFHRDTALFEYATFEFKIEAGERDLFEYYHRAANNVSIADDEFSESLYFLISPGTENLVIDSSSFDLHKVRYVPHYYGPPSHGVADSGKITVTKIGTGSYQVTVDVGFELRHGQRFFEDSLHTNRARLKFERTFRK